MKNIVYLSVLLTAATFLFACKKETVAPYAHIVGYWDCKETYTAYLGDSVVVKATSNFELVFKEGGIGSQIEKGTFINDTIPFVWFYNEINNEFDIITKINSGGVNINAYPYPFTIEENKPTSQKWSCFTSYLTTGNKVRKSVIQWSLTKK